MTKFHPSLLPNVLQTVCAYCIFENTGKYPCLTSYKMVHTDEFRQESAQCVPSTGISYRFNNTCGSDLRPRRISNCTISRITKTTLNVSCIDIRKKTHRYNCESYLSQRWKFYPQSPEFPTYWNFMMFMICFCLFCVLTVALNSFSMFVIFKSKEMRESKSIIFAAHMVLIDFFIGIVLMPLTITSELAANELAFKGKPFVPYEISQIIYIWYSRLDLCFLMATFINFALMSIERCVVVLKPLWHFRYVTYKKICFSVPLVWLYTGAVAFIFYYTGGHHMLINISLGFAFPTLVMIVSYVCIIANVLFRSSKIAEDKVTTERKRKIEQTVAKKLVFLLLVFLTFWLPYFILLTIHQHKMHSLSQDVILGLHWTRLFSYGHCVFDPVLYMLARPNVRKEIKSIFKSNKNQTPRSARGMTITSTIFGASLNDIRMSAISTNDVSLVGYQSTKKQQGL